MAPTDPSEDSSSAPPVTALARGQELAFAASTAALLAALLPAARLADRSGGAVFSLLPAIAAAALPLALFGVLLARSAGDGLRALCGRGPNQPAPLLSPWFAALGVLMLVGTALGAVLFATTHHRGLAGVTFALAFGLATVGTGLVARRTVRLLDGASPKIRRLAAAASWLLFGLSVLTLGRLFATAPASFATALVQDGFVLAISVALASTEGIQHAGRAAGVPLLVAILGGAVVTGLPKLTDPTPVTSADLEGRADLEGGKAVSPLADSVPLYAAPLKLLKR